MIVPSVAPCIATTKFQKKGEKSGSTIVIATSGIVINARAGLQEMLKKRQGHLMIACR